MLHLICPVKFSSDDHIKQIFIIFEYLLENMSRSTKYYSLTEITGSVGLSEGTVVAIASGSVVALPDDHQILMQKNIKEILEELRKMNTYLSYIAGGEICQ